MLARERRQLLVNEVNAEGALVTSTMAACLGVSDVTIRADLDQLERGGRLTRTRGGAVPAADASAPIVAFDLRMALRSAEKRAIALKAAELVSVDQSLILDAGTTVHHLAQVLPDRGHLTVYTPSLSVSQRLLGVDGVDVHLFGGRIDTSALQTVGTPREQGLKGVLVQTLFLGAFAIDDDLDIVDRSPVMARVKLHYVKRARRIVVLADSTKFGKTGSTKVLSLEQVDTLITDDKVTDEQRQQLANRDIKVIVA